MIAQGAKPVGVHPAERDAASIKAACQLRKTGHPDRLGARVAARGKDRRDEYDRCAQPLGKVKLAATVDGQRHRRLTAPKTATRRSVRAIGSGNRLSCDQNDMAPRARNPQHGTKQAVPRGGRRGVMTKYDSRSRRQCPHGGKEIGHAFIAEQPDSRPVGPVGGDESRRVAGGHVGPYSSAL